eukprot:4827879-Pyramimonas_sp.AAC.1
MEALQDPGFPLDFVWKQPKIPVSLPSDVLLWVPWWRAVQEREKSMNFCHSSVLPAAGCSGGRPRSRSAK